MVLCVLCLEIIEDKLYSIKANSVQWKELDIANKIEKHFWSLNIIQHNSCTICLSCWQELDDFHTFYKRIEEAHMKDCKEELVMQVSKIKDNDKESYAHNIAYCALEPEILIDQTQPLEITEPNILDVDDILLQKLANKDPLEKLKELSVDKPGKNKHSKRRASIDEKSRDGKKLKEEPVMYIDNSDRVTNNNDDVIDGRFLLESNSPQNLKSKHYTKREESDNFIAEHFKYMFCDLCHEPFKEFSAVQKHFFETHQQQGYVVCCERKYFRRRLLVDHIHSHLNPDYFKCDKCSKVMSDRLRLEKHIMCVHQSEELVKKHCCDECGKSFARADRLRKHKLTHLPKDDKKFPCSECGKFYATSHLLHRHIQAVHLKKFVKICYICGKSIGNSAAYITHMSKHLGEPQPIISCDICGLRVTTERGLKRHKNGQHPVGGKKDHQCPKCPKKSPTLKALRKHINTMHEKGREHKCTVCQKLFKRKENLREHMAQHTGTPLYSCPWCPKTFNSNSNMHSHRKKLHPKECEEAKLQKYFLNVKSAIVNNS